MFTLYPGGEFVINNSFYDQKLEAVCRSPLLKKIIATQGLTYNYLIKKDFVPNEKVEFIYGGVEDSNYFKDNYVQKIL